jgi:hypothetical protein
MLGMILTFARLRCFVCDWLFASPLRQRPLTILCAIEIHKAISRPIIYALSFALTHALTRSSGQDEECADCGGTGAGQAKGCQACRITRANDYYVDHYVDYYSKYFEKYYSFYYTEHYVRMFTMQQLKASGA